jgi:hypothetical protein
MLNRAQQLAKETDGCNAISLRLHQDIDHRPVLVHRTPQIMLPPLIFENT